MELLLLEIVEFLIELIVVASFTTLVTVAVSIGMLRVTELYTRKAFVIGVPVMFAILVAASGPTDHTSLRQWAFFALPPMVTSPLFVLSFFRKRMQKTKKA